MAEPTVADLAKSDLRSRIAQILSRTREATHEATGIPTAVGASPLPAPVVEEEEETV
jgi:hypothetical protein